MLPCRTHSPRMARATNSCTPRWFGRRTARVLLADFWYFSSQKSTIKEKLLYDIYLSEFFSLVRKEQKGQKEERIDSRLGDADRVRLRESVNSPQEKAFYPLFLLHMRAQKKKL